MFKWVALVVVTAAVVATGALVAHSVSQRTTTVITQTSTQTGQATSGATNPSSLFDADEAAFVKVCLTDQGTPHTLHICNCIYHWLRDHGYPASTLAVSTNLIGEFGSDITRADLACSGR
jgi:hypothetical protein